MKPVSTKTVLGVPIATLLVSEAVRAIIRMASSDNAHYICFATAHMLVEAHDDEVLLSGLKSASMVVPDGTAVSWCMRLLGGRAFSCLDGPTMTPLILAEAAKQGLSVGFHGGTEDMLSDLVNVVKSRWPALRVSYVCSPPFRPLSDCLESATVEALRRSAVDILFVGLGSTKQERWMSLHRDCVPCTMLGVGAALDFLAGRKKAPPKLLKAAGLAWLARLVQEPRRLWRRNLEYSPRFVSLVTREIYRHMMQGVL